MAVLTVQRTSGGLNPVYAAASPAGDVFANTGAQTVLVRNLGPLAGTVTVAGTGLCTCPPGYLHPLSFSIPAGATILLPVFSPYFYNDGNGNVSLGYAGSVLLAPVAPVVAAGAAGNPNGTYRCQVTFVDAAGETTGGVEAVVTVVNQQIAWSSIPLGPSPTTARKLYRVLLLAADAGVVSEAAQIVQTGAAQIGAGDAGTVTEAAVITQVGQVGTLRLVTTLADNTTTTFTDNVADSALGAGIPLVNTANVLQVAVTAP
jgi:hypothetical protein